jgi:hypothetical protein
MGIALVRQGEHVRPTLTVSVLTNLYPVVAVVRLEGPLCSYRGKKGGWGMARDDSIVWVQLATRVPKALHRELKLHSGTVDTSVMDFVVRAIEEKLAGSGGRPAKGRGKRP